MRADLVRLPNGKYTTEADVNFMRQVLGDDGARRVLALDGVGTRQPMSVNPRYSQAYLAKMKADRSWSYLPPEAQKLREQGYGIWQVKAMLQRPQRARPVAREPQSRAAPNSPRRAAPAASSWAARRAQLDAIEVDPTKERPWYASLAEQALTVFQAERLRAEQKKRIEAGLPPLTAAQARALAPTANVNVSLPPQLQTALIIGGIGLAGLLLLRLTKSPRSRSGGYRGLV